MEHLEQRFQGHDRRISDAEKKLHDIEVRESRRDGQLELFKVQLASVDGKVMDIKDSVKDVTTAVKADGEKTRLQQEAQQAAMTNITTRLLERMDNLDAYKEAAATREHETKRTKLQIARDVMLALLAGTVGIQELIQWISENF